MRTTTRAALAAWLDTLADSRAVIAPQQVERDLLYRQVTSSSQVVFDFERTVASPKTFFLPDTEVILEIERRGSRAELVEPALIREQVVFGMRPCDARALLVLDALLLGRPPPDAYYAERRAKTALIGLACPRMWAGCFCTSVGGAPDDASAVDVMLYEDAGQYLVQGVTPKGAELLESLAAAETDRHPSPSDRSGNAPVEVTPPHDWLALFDDPYWQRLAERCLSCHACTYVCPTCRCFDVRDDAPAAGPGSVHVQRLRSWDSCMSAGYRRIAGGHNPRPTKAQRLRNRYYCKFCYSPLDFGVVACVGCGRCSSACPVDVDVAEMLDDLKEQRMRAGQ
ncbi:MAG TPA: 4Fe-4S dicluster domain-containing protein [Anaerolineae bacterium]|nr:4Fe-4S dicluster domain-containing protein [Anaerolineae bacterium]